MCKSPTVLIAKIFGVKHKHKRSIPWANTAVVLYEATMMIASTEPATPPELAIMTASADATATAASLETTTTAASHD